MIIEVMYGGGHSQAGTSSRKMPKKATLVRRLAIRYTVFSITMPTKKKA